MKKKKLKLLIVLIAVISIAFLGYKMVAKIQYKDRVAKNIQSLPQFELKSLKGSIYNDKMIQNTSFALIYFNSECHYCQNETETIKNNIEKFKTFQLLFISNQPKDTIQKFANTYNLSNYDNIHFLHDSRDTITTVFDINTIPSILVYDSHKKLKHRFKGQVRVDSLLTYLTK